MDSEATDAGITWAEALRSRLEAEGREATGGWPGTMTEARARAGRLGIDDLSPEERRRLGRILYAAAREAWARG